MLWENAWFAMLTSQNNAENWKNVRSLWGKAIPQNSLTQRLGGLEFGRRDPPPPAMHIFHTPEPLLAKLLHCGRPTGPLAPGAFLLKPRKSASRPALTQAAALVQRCFAALSPEEFWQTLLPAREQPSPQGEAYSQRRCTPHTRRSIPSDLAVGRWRLSGGLCCIGWMDG